MNNFKFDVYIYGDTQEISPVLSKARVRIFYKGLNRNYTYITDEFATKLLGTLPYTPIIGKFEDGDFTNHGRGEQLQVYGIVPENPNVTWEDHEDYDGEVRNYACADVLLFTARFPEAKAIVGGTGQSMELYDKSVKGDWVYENGKKFYRFDDACFIGLCALGDNTEPCFEGAAFYEYADSLKAIAEELRKYNINNGGRATMDFKFKLSDSQKLEAIFELINADGWFENTVCQVYDDYALCYNYAENKYFRAYYKKDDEADKVEITEKVDAYVLDVTENEYEVLKRLGEMSNNNYSAIEEELNSYRNSQSEEEIDKPAEEFEAKGEADEGTDLEDDALEDDVVEDEDAEDDEDIEKEDDVTEEDDEVDDTEETEDTPEEEPENNYELKISQYENQIRELNEKIDTYKLENENLQEYKKSVENNKKLNFLNKYSKKLPKDIVEDFKAKIDEYVFEDFKKEVSTKVLENNSDFEDKEEMLPTGNYEFDNTTLTGGERLLANYMKNKNK